MIPDRLRWGIIVTVTLVWVANFVAGIVVEDYEPDETIGGIFMGTVGVMLAAGSRKGDSGERDG